MQLHLDGVLVGTLTDYGYETPWASARITPVDAGAWARLVRASKFDTLGDLPDDDAEYDRLAASLDVTEADLATLRGDWSIVHPGSPRSGAIDLQECGDDGWIRWRWR